MTKKTNQKKHTETDRDGESRILHSRSSPKRIRSIRIRKCISPFLANSDVKRGLSNSMEDIVACDRIFCTKCDNNVLQIERGSWTAGTDYVFIRNSFPDEVMMLAFLLLIHLGGNVPPNPLSLSLLKHTDQASN